jgi:hypothetical protein
MMLRFILKALSAEPSLVQIKPPQPKFLSITSATLQPSEFVSQWIFENVAKDLPRSHDGTGMSIVSGLRLIRPESMPSAEVTSYKPSRYLSTCNRSSLGRRATRLLSP